MDTVRGVQKGGYSIVRALGVCLVVWCEGGVFKKKTTVALILFSDCLIVFAERVELQCHASSLCVFNDAHLVD